MKNHVRAGGPMCRRAAAPAGTLAVAGAAVCVTASPASAAGWGCDHDGHTVWCASVTGISSGSYLASHNGPSYASGTRQYHNGDTMMLACWTTGDGDADGHRDPYWFALDSDSDSGYINDCYVTTGSPSQWQPHVPRCH
jgi:hypothetical protein